jgi:glycosyltransferase involved in cell wall biosynthesis
MLVSVVVPVFNDAAGIRRALQSRAGQAYPPKAYEIIVADNGSTDETRRVVRQFQEEDGDLVRLAVEDQIQSSYAARNKGIQTAKGEIVAFTDADCVPAAEWLREGIDAIVQGDAGFAAGQVKMTFQGEQPNLWEYYDARKLKQLSYVTDAGFGATANLFVRRSLFDKYGLFRDDLQSGGDYEFGRRLTTSGEKLVYAHDAVVCHPARSTFKSILKKSERVAKGQRQLAEMGLLEHDTLSWRSLIPLRRGPSIEDVPLNPHQRLAIVLIANFFKYYNLAQRLWQPWLLNSR